MMMWTKMKVVAVAACVAVVAGGLAGGWVLLGAGVSRPFNAAEWVKIAGIPRDLLGRELPPGMGGAWCWVPELKGFLLYGGYSPRYTNEGWLFDPAGGEMRLLWPDDTLAYDAGRGKWYALYPRETAWSHDRPGPARGMAAVYVPKTRRVYLFGGHPYGKARLSWFGGTKIGTWELDPKTMKFSLLTADGPRGIVKAVYDVSSGLIVTAPVKPPWDRKREKPVVWVFDPLSKKWERRPSAEPRPGPHPAFSYDAAAGTCVYFSAYGETWTYDAKNNRWTNMKPAVSPPPRWHAAMVYVPALKGSLLHGGIATRDGKNAWRGYKALRIKREGMQYRDTWVYEAANNKWRELRGVEGPGGAGGSATVRDMCALDTDRGAVVFYDPGKGIWAMNVPSSYARRSDAPAVVVPEEVKKVASSRGKGAAVLDEHAAKWRKAVRAMPDDSWFDVWKQLKIGKPVQGCISFGYNPRAGLLYWIAGCNGATFKTYEDYKYNNQFMIFDMYVGRWFQQRANHPWMPESSMKRCPANGCGRTICYDAKRDRVWTMGGVTGFGLPGTRRLQAYRFREDTFLTPEAGSAAGSDCGMVYDAKNDCLVLVKGGYSPLKTMVYDFKAKKWRRGMDHPVKFSQYTKVVYDPRLGVVMVTPVPRAWKLGSTLPGGAKKWRTMPLAMRVYVYDSAGDTWTRFTASGEEKVPAKYGELGVTYDPGKRVIYVFINNARHEYGAPARPMNVFILDLEAKRWIRGRDSFPLKHIEKGSAVYDGKRNVCVVGAGGRIYLYRWKGGCPRDAFEPGKK